MWYNPFYSSNIVRDWNKLQGMTHPSDEHIQIRRDLNSRLISIENSSEKPVLVAISTYPDGPDPQNKWILRGGEIKNLGINTFDGPDQFLYIFNPYTGERLSIPAVLRHDAVSFVLREGLNKWFVQGFKKSVYRA